ncbi:hypothetical protein MGAST_16930 [Mycobacterium gastri 'Wayne']|uniref:Uncharacterized protein n=1 Tax=Mycobacterium gastri TaxID=1777 RepID=A0A1X1VUS6_MYCGS|nr:hypothetical protein MGAST_16930 [Mycobacterium gastri 'Wayne']ORV72844.1 hypothetical protein AWC07_03195 [Mycobacterium gastri]
MPRVQTGPLALALSVSARASTDRRSEPERDRLAQELGVDSMFGRPIRNLVQSFAPRNRRWIAMRSSESELRTVPFAVRTPSSAILNR